MELVKNPKIDWLGMKWYFIGFSLAMIAASVVSLFATAGLRLSVDFTGGTLLLVKFKDTPDLEQIRRLLADGGFRAQDVIRYDDPSLNEVQIRMGEVKADEEGDLELAELSQQVSLALSKEFDPLSVGTSKADLNAASAGVLTKWSSGLDAADFGEGEERPSAEEIARAVADYRDSNGGLIWDTSQLESLDIPPGVKKRLTEDFYLGSFAILSSEAVGPKVGNELKERARMAILASLVGMLAYIWFRFRLIYGIGAILALFHDVFITLGLFSILGKEISLTVIAALLTLVGYSLNDTIVVFDRVRENEREVRRRSLTEIVNLSINQTLNRTILTSLTFFMAAFALFLFGGDALNGFSLALVIGVVVGTYSSIAIASPVVIWWEEGRARKLRPARAR